MSVIFMLVGFSLLAALVFLFSFIWAIKDGQYDDDYTPSVRMLFDDTDELLPPEDKSAKGEISITKTNIKSVNN